MGSSIKLSLNKRIILINGRFLLQPTTGVQRYAKEVINAISQIDPPQFRFIIAIPYHKPIDNTSRIEILPDNSNLPSSLWQQLKLPLLIKKTGADLVWSPCNIGPVFIKNQVVSIHDASVFAGPEWFTKKFRAYYRFILPLLGGAAKRVITFSNFSKRELIRNGIASEEKVIVIPEGINQAFIPKREKILSFPYILTVGSRDPRKNVTRLIKAWENIPLDIKQDRKLVIAGAGLHSFSSEGLKAVPEDVHFIGHITDKDLPSLYSGADLFIYPSLYEGFGLPPLEAMACGCPVIVSNVASLPEVCGDAGYYVDPYSVESIAEGMQRVLTDENLRMSLIKKGFERAKLFSWEKSAKEHLKVFDEILNTKDNYNLIK